MKTTETFRPARVLAAGLAALILAGAAGAQTTAQEPARHEERKPAPPPVRRAKPARKPVIDLEAQAKERRPGQILPGDPPPFAPTSPPEGRVRTAPDGTLDLPAAATPAGNAIVAPAAVDAPPGPFSERLKSPAGPAATAPAPEPETTLPAQAPPATAPKTSPPAEPPPPAPEPSPQGPRAAAVAEPAPGTAAPQDVPLVDPLVAHGVGEPSGAGPASARVVSVGASGVQWRSGAGPWGTPEAGLEAEGRIEVRAGLDADLVLVVDGRAEVRVTRLGRAVIERSVEPGGGGVPMVTLTRGAVEIRPAAGATAGEMLARVKTPDQQFGVLGALRVEYDAFSGTRRRALGQ